MNTIKCNVDSRWMWSIENACVMITSPAGGYVRVDKWHMDKLTDTQRELVWKCVNAYNGTSNSNIELTIAEMNELVTIGNIAGTVYKKYKKPTTTLVQRKAQWRKKTPDTGKCSCGGQIVQKDHTTWIGWYCPKCKAGGSKNAPRKRY